jgi:hypothetical protein
VGLQVMGSGGQLVVLLVMAVVGSEAVLVMGLVIR